MTATRRKYVDPKAKKESKASLIVHNTNVKVSKSTHLQPFHRQQDYRQFLFANPNTNKKHEKSHNRKRSPTHCTVIMKI